MADLAERQCVPCRGGVPPMKGDEVEKLSAQLPEWEVVNALAGPKLRSRSGHIRLTG